MQLEQNFSRMNPSKVAKGHAAVKGILAAAGTAATAYALVHSPAGKAAIANGKKFMEKSSAAMAKKLAKKAASGQLALF